jgi:large subunit ribosomal protein L25
MSLESEKPNMATQATKLSVQKRTIKGKKVKTLRSSGILPGHVFGNHTENADVQVDAKTFAKVYKLVGETGLIDLQVEGESATRPVLIDDYALHPVTGNILHVDFHQVNLKEKVQATVPIETVGESKAILEGAVLVMAYNEVEVEALPTDLPDRLEVDLSKLDAVGSDVKFSDLSYDRSKVTIMDINDDDVVATLQAPKEEVVEEVSATPEEVELTKQGATTEEGKEMAGSSEAAPKESKEEKK